jgi:hypothetical protein
VAPQRERRKRRSDRRDRSDDDCVVRLDDQDQDQDRDRGRKDHDDDDQDAGREGREQEGRDRDREEVGQEGRDRDREGRRQEENNDHDRQGGRPEPLPALEILEAAKDQLTVLTGRFSDSVSGLMRSNNGWRMKIDTVELEKIPPSTSIMATYAVEMDREGNVIGYEQERRYLRGRADD